MISSELFNGVVEALFNETDEATNNQLQQFINEGKSSLKRRRVSLDMNEALEVFRDSPNKRELKDEEKRLETAANTAEKSQPAINMELANISIDPIEDPYQNIDEDFKSKTLKAFVPKTNEVLTYDFNNQTWRATEIESTQSNITFNSRSASVTTTKDNGELFTLITGGDASKDIF